MNFKIFMRDLKIGDVLIIKGIEYVFKGYKKNLLLGQCRKFVSKKNGIQLFSSRMDLQEITEYGGGKFLWRR